MDSSVAALIALISLSLPPTLRAQIAEERETDYALIDRELPKPDSPAAGLKETAQGIIDATNEFRKQEGLQAVESNESLTRAAADFAQFMARTHRYGHTADGRQPSQRAEAAGYDYCSVSENIAYQYDSEGMATSALVSAFVEGWKESPGHRENMLTPFSLHTGLAVARSEETGAYFAVQMFGRPRSAALSFRVVNKSGQEVRYVAQVHQEDGSKREFVLAPDMIRTHERCRPVEITVPATDRGAPVEIEDGDELRLVLKDGSIAVVVVD